ncbi:MAG: hypothetical protein H7Z13_00780 [Ferruginibacter sp.]|nr:hypothetical protein [Ferruginibacter sp.]
MAKFRIIFTTVCIVLLGAFTIVSAQVNTVEFGKNRVQYKKFKWQYYQTRNFNTYFNQNGQELAKFVAQVAEEEAPKIEAFTEYSLQRRANIIVYNEFADLQQSNIGLGIDWQITGGATQLVNNKMVVYFNGDHAHLRKQIREGIARILTDNILFGDDLGEFAGNQALLDLPKWLTDGYVAFAGENWSTALDDELKSEILSGNYRNFYQFAFDKPLLAGHSFWHYIEEKYKKENVTYLLYLARVYKNLNRACLQICKKKFKEVLADFMEFEDEKYYKDISRRKAYPKGNYIEGFDITKRQDYYRINVNPIARNNSFAVVEFKKGLVKLKLSEDFDYTTLLKYGIRSYKNETNPDYPIMAWDPKGTRLTVIYKKEGKIKLFVYDAVTRIKYPKLDLTDKFQQIQDVKYMLDSKTLLLSAVKNGHTDIFTFNLENEKVQQITNDVYDDLDATFVSFPGKTGIIFASNRPNPDARTGDTVLPSKNRYNIFMITNFGNKSELNQVSQLSHLKYGNARYPMPYNSNHFTFISDENGVANRYAGFFSTKAAGLDTLVLIADEILRNPSLKDVDSTLRVYKKTDVDSIAVVAVSQDSAYTFPLTNYESSVAETRIAGDNNQVSEVTRQSNEKNLYKLKIDENTLRRRNVTVPPTTYMKGIVMADKIQQTSTGIYDKPLVTTDTVHNKNNLFQTEFENEKKDSSRLGKTYDTEEYEKNDVLKKAKLYVYKPVKFGAEYGGVGFNNSLLYNRYQAYGGDPMGQPINLGSNTELNGLIRLGTSELMEDVKITGAFKISSNLRDNEWLMSYTNLKRRFDWGLTYYRNVLGGGNYRTFTNLYQGSVAYPFDNSKRLKLDLGIRSDKSVFYTDFEDVRSLDPIYDTVRKFVTTHLEYVYDNTLNPTQNIWNGLRYKLYFDWNTDISKDSVATGKFNFNWGFDTRYYYPIYRNFIWAGRVAGEFSWGNQKTIYFAGGTDGWLFPKINNNPPARDNYYTFQTLAVNLRGFSQNISNGNNNLILNSEFRLPVFTTLFSRPINNAFLRNFQLVQFFDLGAAWNGSYNGLKRPSVIISRTPIQIVSKVGGLGPFAGSYGFGARSTLLGYFVRFDAGWQMNGLFNHKPVLHVSLGLDF